MAGFTKLFNSILHSTIWQEPHETRLVWITMLAMADRKGEVQASLPGLAHATRVTIEECETAIAALESPDPHSRTPDHEGRRIEKVAGGWTLLNHGLYRKKLSEEERREYNRLKQKEYRARKKAEEAAADVNDALPDVNDNVSCQHKQKQSTEAEAGNGDADASLVGKADVEAAWKASPFPQIREWNHKRLAALKTRSREPFFCENWKAGIRKASESEFLRGDEGGWKMTIDWFLKPGNLAKIIEGNYNGTHQRSNRPGRTTDRNAGTRNDPAPYRNL